MHSSGLVVKFMNTSHSSHFLMKFDEKVIETIVKRGEGGGGELGRDESVY